MIIPTPGVAFALLIQAGGASGGGSLAPLAFQIGAIVIIFYVFMWMPQRKQRKQHEETLKSLKRGDQVVTAGGIIGEVIHIREATKDGGANRLDDQVTIKSAESRLIIERGRIARVVGTSNATAAKDAEKPAS
ncbi:MAG TPA: preprotein translocase subunit YajC [Gemmatimonadaceae bacterium]|jgi:preprotein translocase subunit YajC